MSKRLEALWDENVEAVTMRKDDFYRHIGDIVVENIELHRLLEKATDLVFNEGFKFTYWVEDENGKVDLKESKYKIKSISPTMVRNLWDILNDL